MDSTTILNALFWIMGVVGGGFLAYGGWLCLLHHFSRDRKQPQPDNATAASDWPHAAHTS